MKTKILILIFAFTGATAMHTAQAQTYDPLAVQRINDLILNNGLVGATYNAPETWWRFATWNDETPKKIVGLYFDDMFSGGGTASFAGLTTLQTLAILSIGSTGMTKVDVSNCIQLQTLDCSCYDIREIDLTGCIELQSLSCSMNSLLSLDLAQLDKLTLFNGSGQFIRLTLHKNEAGEYTLPVSLNNPSFTNSAISYSEGILKSTDETVEGTDFSVQTNKEGFELTGGIMFIYSDKPGIDSPESMQLKIYPNPNTGELRIANYELRITSVEVFDINGRKQETENRRQETEREIVIDISHLPTGVYFVKVMTEQGGITKKIMKR